MATTMATISPTRSSLLSFAVTVVGGYDEDVRGIDEVIVDDEGAAGFVEAVEGEDVCGFDVTGDVDVGEGDDVRAFDVIGDVEVDTTDLIREVKKVLVGKKGLLEIGVGSSAGVNADADAVVLAGVVLDGVEGIAAPSCATPKSTIGHR